MRFTVLTLFPDIIHLYTNKSILGRAQKKGLIKIEVIDIRKYTKDRHKTADGKPYGGGPGMVVKAEPILKAYDGIKRKGKRILIIVLSAGGKVFTEKNATTFMRDFDHVIIICGRYEGIDERVVRALRAKKLSVGNFVLTGGEVPALIVIDAVSRLVSGVLGKEESLEEKRLGVGIPTYTRPEALKYKGKTYRVPRVLLSGDHEKIEKFRKKRQRYKK